MTTVTFEKYRTKMAKLGGESTVPSIFQMHNVQQLTENCLEEEDGLYVGYGFLVDSFPYKKQNLYTREIEETHLPSVVLENEYLKAVFLPTLGARLWQLYDKKAGRDLMLTNEEIAFGNLASRTAWFCGGTEWNFGIIGHTPFTCSPVYAATLKTDNGTPVARFYEYERIRGCTYQLDCWLPEGSPRLYVGVRIVNPNETMVPTYWWSNIAVAEDPGARVIVPASEAYVNDGACVSKIKSFQTPEGDVTYPVQNKRSIDHFWRTKDAEHKFVAYVDKEGYGLCQASTSAQQGRKLFVWGQSRGADNWQKILKTKGINGHYVEIQAGLGQTQYECIPMPPNTAWSWVESYGPIQMNPADAHGAYERAWKEADRIVSGYGLEEVLKSAAHLKRPADRIVMEGSGWGALEELSRQGRKIRPLSYNLTFGNLGAEQRQWVRLLQEGTLGEHDPDEAPDSWMLDERFTELLEKAVKDKDRENWYAYLQLGVIYQVQERLADAERCLCKALELKENAWAHYALACLEWKRENRKEAVAEAVRAFSVKRDDVSLGRAVLEILSAAGEHALLVEETEKLPENIRKDGWIRLEYAVSCLAIGEDAKAEALAGEDPACFASYVREGNRKATDFWITLETRKRQKLGLDTSQVAQSVPEAWDFRMHDVQ